MVCTKYECELCDVLCIDVALHAVSQSKLLLFQPSLLQTLAFAQEVKNTNAHWTKYTFML